MTPATLFGIDIVDRASRLVAADAAEEHGLPELAAALRDTNRALVVEPTDPPVLLPEVTIWRKTIKWRSNWKTPGSGWRAASGLVEKLMAQPKWSEVTLHFVSEGWDKRNAPKERLHPCWSRSRFDELFDEEPEQTHPLDDKDFGVVAGTLLYCGAEYPHVNEAEARRRHCQSRQVIFFVAHADAPRFGFLYVPAFPEIERKSP